MLFSGYTVVAAGFFLLSLFVDLFATLLTALGLRCRDPNKKYKYYRTAVYVMAVACKYNWHFFFFSSSYYLTLYTLQTYAIFRHKTKDENMNAYLTKT